MVNQAMMLVTEKGNVVVANEVAKNLIHEADLIGLDPHGILKTSDKTFDFELLNSIGLMANTSNGKGSHARKLISLPRASNASPCLAEISPILDTNKEIDQYFRGAIITIVDPDHRSAIDLEGLDVVYGLTPTESAVAKLLVDGLSNAEIAEQRNVSTETIKSQVSSLYSKSQSNSRTEFVRRVLNFNLPISPT